MFVKDILHLSPLGLITARPEMSVREATRNMAKNNIGIVAVTNDQGHIVGVLSERDILICLGTSDTPIEDIAVGDLMTEGVITVSPEDSLIDAVLTMNIHGIRHLIAAEYNKPVGVMSIRDVLRVFAQQFADDGSNGDGQFTQEFVRALAAA